jgi:hypothetical protein
MSRRPHYVVRQLNLALASAVNCRFLVALRSCENDGDGSAGKLAALTQFVATFGVREVVHPQLPSSVPDAWAYQWRQPACDLEAGPIRVRDGGFGDHGARAIVGAKA